jgi:alkylation response protein AidB-like acyl-CoA dehydrogenase
MDFNDTAELAEFRHRVADFLDANAQRRTDNQLRGMEGEQAFLEGKEWYARKAEAGLACLTWPKEYGGAGLTPLHEVIWAQEAENYLTRDAQFVIGIGRTSGASCSASPVPVLTWRGCAPGRSAGATSGWSTARRSGPPVHSILTTAWC